MIKNLFKINLSLNALENLAENFDQKKKETLAENNLYAHTLSHLKLAERTLDGVGS